MSNWLEELKEGDEVIVWLGGWRGRDVVETVKRVTPTIITTSYSSRTLQFNRKNGYERGHKGTGRAQLEEAKPEHVNAIRERQFRQSAVSKLRGIVERDGEKISTDQLRRICAILDEEQPA